MSIMRRLRALLPALALVATAAQPISAEELVDGIAAQVGGDIVLVSEVNQSAAAAEARLREKGGTETDVAMLRAEFLERMIEKALISQVVKRAELEATPAEVDEAIEAIANENDLTVESLQSSVEAQGLSFEGYRRRIKSEIEQSKVIGGMVRSQVRVDEGEITRQVRRGVLEPAERRHRGLPAPPADPLRPERAGAEGEGLRPDARGPGPYRGRRGLRAARRRVLRGQPPARRRSRLDPPERAGAGWMTQAVDPLEKGQVSDVIEMPFGCNLLQLVERREYQPLTYEQARDVVRQAIFNEKMGAKYRSFMDDLRERTYIERKGVYADAARLQTVRPQGEGDF